MNNKEVKTIREAALEFMKKATVTLVADVSNTVRIELPVLGNDKKPLYMFVIKRKDSRRFSIIAHTESVGILPGNETLNILQAMLDSYGLLLSPEAVIMEENVKIPLHQRIGTMAQALIGVDGVRRLWKSESLRRPNVTSQVVGSTRKGSHRS